MYTANYRVSPRRRHSTPGVASIRRRHNTASLVRRRSALNLSVLGLATRAAAVATTSPYAFGAAIGNAGVTAASRRTAINSAFSEGSGWTRRACRASPRKPRCTRRWGTTHPWRRRKSAVASPGSRRKWRPLASARRAVRSPARAAVDRAIAAASCATSTGARSGAGRPCLS